MSWILDLDALLLTSILRNIVPEFPRQLAYV